MQTVMGYIAQGDIISYWTVNDCIKWCNQFLNNCRANKIRLLDQEAAQWDKAPSK